MANPKQDKSGDQGQEGDLAETKRIMERLVRTPPTPHKPKDEGKPTGKKGAEDPPDHNK